MLAEFAHAEPFHVSEVGIDLVLAADFIQQITRSIGLDLFSFEYYGDGIPVLFLERLVRVNKELQF